MSQPTDDDLAARLADMGEAGDPPSTETRLVQTPAWMVEAKPIVTAVDDGDDGQAIVVVINAIPGDEP